MENSFLMWINSLKVSKYLVSIIFLFKYSAAQSIGYHPQFNFGFNPYFSPVFGYGLGLPFGAYNLSPAKNPLLLGSISAAAPLSEKHGFISKIHAKAFLNKLATSQLINLSAYPIGGGNVKDKLNILKHPEFALSPYVNGYGYGKHYGAAVLPNDPYKSVLGESYNNKANIGVPIGTHKFGGPLKTENIVGHDALTTSSSNGFASDNGPMLIDKSSYGRILKPIIKTGAFLTSLAILGKKLLEAPVRLNPSGMILQDIQP